MILLAFKQHAHAYHKIFGGQFVLVQPKPFADDTFHVVAFVCPFGSFFAHHQAQTRVPQRIVSRLQHGKKGARTLFS